MDPRDPCVGCYVQGRGREVRISECQFNLIGVHPCRGAEEPCREATVICTNYTPVRGEDRQGKIYGRVCGMKMICDRGGETEKRGIMGCFENTAAGVVHR